MDNYSGIPDVAIQVRKGYFLPTIDLFKGTSAMTKQIRREENQRDVQIAGRTFTAVVFQVALEDVKNTQFNKFLADAVHYMEEHAPNDLFQQALPYLRALNQKTTAYETLDYPPFSVLLPEDNELLLEWNFEHFTIGLSFEADPEASSWYTVNDGTVRKTTQWGYLNSQPISELMNKIAAQLMEG
jgi:hypothetical protein